MNKNKLQPNNRQGGNEGAVQVVAQQTAFHGPIPHPDILERYEHIVPGSADRLIRMAEEESSHRHRLETESLDAEIAARNRQLDIADQQARAVFKSDSLGQCLGACISLASIAGCVFLALYGQPWVAAGLVGLPLAGVIRALRNQPKDNKQPLSNQDA